MAQVRPFPMSSVVDGTDLSGLTLDGRYQLERPLGEGAMGQVYIGHDQSLDRRVAVKVLHSRLASEDKHRQRFLREARAATRIKHPNVVAMFDFGTTPDGSVYLVMELLHGRDLRTMLQEDGPLPWSRARHFLLQAVAALREAHRQEVIHRDIKPANCFVCDPPEAGVPERMKLLDFGIAKLERDPGASATGSDGKPLTQTGELMGTLAYMAPEFAEGRPASMHSDMYALGIMAYQLITGDVPFTGRNEFQVLARHLNEPPVRPRVLVPELSEAAEAVILTLLAKKPEHRFECMADVEQALLAIPADATGPVAFPPGSESNGGRPVVRQREPGLSRSGAPPLGRLRRFTPRAIPVDPSLSSPSAGHPASPGAATPRAGEGHEGDQPAPRGEDSSASSWDEGVVSKSDAERAISDVWEVAGPLDSGLESREHQIPGPADDIEVQLPRREWGKAITVLVLVLFSAVVVAVVSVVLR